MNSSQMKIHSLVDKVALFDMQQSKNKNFKVKQ